MNTSLAGEQGGPPTTAGPEHPAGGVLVLAGLRKCCGLWVVLGLFMIVVGFINPLRDAPVWGDEWAYVSMVRNLLDKAEYRLDNWSAANMQVQIYWGAVLTRVFGFSFIVLHASTLILLGAGLVAFYLLLRDLDCDDTQAGLLSLSLLASPLVLFLGFTYQTDVQFLSWMLIACWLYARALRRQSLVIIALASLAGWAAIGTRQFAVALVAGLVGTWALAEPDRRHTIPIYLAGSALPVTAAIWQFELGASRASFTQAVRMEEQLAYMRDLPGFIVEAMWRPAVIVQYMVLFLLPLLPLCAVLLRNPWRKRPAAGGSIVLLVAWTAYVVVADLYGYFLYGRFAAQMPTELVDYAWMHGLQGRFLIPSLGWILSNMPLFPVGLRSQLVLTTLTSGVAIAMGSVLLRRYAAPERWRALPREGCFFLLTGAALIACHLLYVQFYDSYLIQFLPFVIIAIALSRGGKWPRWCTGLVAIMGVAMLITSALWSRGNIAASEAEWRAAQIAQADGAAPRRIAGSFTWSVYHGAFDAWVDSLSGPDPVKENSGSNRMHRIFRAYLLDEWARASHLVTSSLQPKITNVNWQLLGTIEYRDAWLRRRYTEVFKQVE